MSIKSLILYNLAILTLGAIAQAAIAQPTTESDRPSAPQLAQGSDSTSPEPTTVPQWVEPRESTGKTPSQWSPANSPATPTSPQWSDSPVSPQIPITPWQAPSVAEADPLPHVIVPASPRPHREQTIATEPSSAQTPETPTNLPPAAEPSSAQTPETSPSPPPAAEPDQCGELTNDQKTGAENGQPPSSCPPSPDSETPSLVSPLTRISSGQPTAAHLRQGDVVFNFYNRTFFVSSSDPGGTAAHPDFGFTWGITDDLELTLEYQQVDSGSPGRQGDFAVSRKTSSVSADGTLVLKQKLWENSDETQALSGVFSLSFGDRGFNYSRNGTTVNEGNSSVVPALQFPFTAWIDDKWQLTISPTLAFFPDNSALYWQVLPIDNPGSFGTTFGFTGAVSYQISPRLTLWGDLFVPVTGNNSISRESGRPEQAIAYNAGLRYLVNPRLGIDVFASNTLGSKGSLALTADSSLTAFGAGVVFMPDFIAANRRYRDSFNPSAEKETPLKIYGLGLFDRDVLNNGQFLGSVVGGTQGIFTSLSYGLVKDAELGIYLDYVFGNVDESEQGFSGKIRLLNQAEGAPLTVSVAGTVGQTNQPFVNYIFDNRNEFKERQLSKSLPFIANTDDKNVGRLFVMTFSLPLNYEFKNGAMVWFNPIWGYVQRSGTEIAGFNLGGSLPISEEVNLMGEVGANFVNPGNTFRGNNRDNAIPWTVALQWDPAKLLGLKPGTSHPKFQLYFTNRLGFSPWLQMRVREQEQMSVGAGIYIPF